MFEPDGWVYRARVGLLVPDNDVGPEAEWSAMVPPGVGAYASRFSFPVAMVAETPGQIPIRRVEHVAAPGPLDAAVQMFADAPMDILALAFTSTSYVGGEGEDSLLIERLSVLAKGKPVITTGQAVLASLKALGAGRVMLVDPPWFPGELTALGRKWLKRNGVEVTLAEPAGLPTGQSNIHPGNLYRWVCASVPQKTEAVVISGNGFRAAGAVHRLESDLGIPVITANTALLWLALKTLGLRSDEVTRYGQLFAAPGR